MTEAIIVALITGGISLIGTLATTRSSAKSTQALVDCKLKELKESVDKHNSLIERPITPSCMDYAVKAAMCDGKGAAWTDAERLAALARMGCTVGDDGTVKWSAV